MVENEDTTWGYGHDLAGRLTQTTRNGDLWAGYGYDSNGNRLTKTTSSQTINGTYDAQDRLLSYGNDTYTYTANGELETKIDTATGETTSYTYDVLGNLKSLLLSDGTQIDYIIDGRNRRVGKKVNGTMERQWIYDGQLRPVAELDGSGALTAQYVYATHINVPDYIVKGGVTYRVITDHLGSLRFVIDTATGTIAQRTDYDDWGNVITNTNADFTPFGFAGGMYDSQTKLVRFGARDYDAECGRWTCKDPIGFGGHSSNYYIYSLNNPVNIKDTNGLWSFTLSNFMGLGGSLEFGINPNGGLFITLKGGGGIGGGWEYNPYGQAVNYEGCPKNWSLSWGLYSSMGLALGPYNITGLSASGGYQYIDWGGSSELEPFGPESDIDDPTLSIEPVENVNMSASASGGFFTSISF